MSDDEQTTPSGSQTIEAVKSIIETADYVDDHPLSSQPAATATAVAIQVSKTSSQKRQLSLTDMFSRVSPAEKKARTASGSVARPIAGGSGAPVKRIGGLQSLNSIQFNIDAYKQSLSEEEKRLLSLECETMGRIWLKVLANEIRKPYFIELKKFLWSEGVQGPSEQSVGSPKIFPPPKDIYNWSRATPLGRLRVVIIGQDPYHGTGQAHGLCFSVRKGIPAPPSLKNMYKEIQTDYPEFVPPKHGDLTSWAENGVLLINTSLTVRANQAGSHANKGWETFTEAVIDQIDKYGGSSFSKNAGGIGRGVVFLAWGSWAIKRVAKMSKTKHLVLTSAHPSPLSAHRGFFGNAHFKKTNEWLENKYGADAKIDWCKLE